MMSHPRLTVELQVPCDQLEQSRSLDLLQQIKKQMQLTFSAFAADRRWPEPHFAVQMSPTAEARWSYRARLADLPILEGELKPGKLLALGSDEALNQLLGLETLDPFMALPAKWIAPAQKERAQRVSLDGLFDEVGLVVAHTLHEVSSRWSESFGLAQLQESLDKVSQAHRELLRAEVTPHQGVFLETVKELISEGLWLPPAEELLEIFSAQASHAQPTPWLLSELVRIRVVPRNLPRLQDREGTLWGVEWRSAAEEKEFELSDRLLRRLEYALSRIPDRGGVPVLLSDAEHRRGLSQALRHVFPSLTVLSWQELGADSGLRVAAVVDTSMEFDPSPWPGRLDEVRFLGNSLHVREQTANPSGLNPGS